MVSLTLPAASLAVKTKVFSPGTRLISLKANSPLTGSASVVYIPLKPISTVDPGSAVPAISTGLVDTKEPSGGDVTSGGSGGVRSMKIVTDAGRLVFPALSVALKEMVLLASSVAKGIQVAAYLPVTGSARARAFHDPVSIMYSTLSTSEKSSVAVTASSTPAIEYASGKRR